MQNTYIMFIAFKCHSFLMCFKFNSKTKHGNHLNYLILKISTKSHRIMLLCVYVQRKYVFN